MLELLIDSTVEEQVLTSSTAGMKKFIIEVDLPVGVSETHFKRFAERALRYAIDREDSNNPMSRLNKDGIKVNLLTKGRR